MKLTDLFEAPSLPLRPDQLPRVRGSYAAFIVTMRPEDFLALTTPDSEAAASIRNRPFPYTPDQYRDALGRDEGYGRYELPFLKVKFPSGEITGHEGRHRAAMIERHGGKVVPVVIYPYSEDVFIVSLEYWDAQDMPQRKRMGPFMSREAADIAIEEETRRLESEGAEEVKHKINREGGGQLKGEPTRSDGWDKAAWRIEDFPAGLIGQFDQTVRVSRDQLRVGLVKGYRHHTR